MAAYNFPNSPSNGDTVTSNGITYTYSSSKTRWDGAAASGSSTTVYATIDLLPLSGVSTGDQAYVSGNNRLYIWNGTGWYNIALINTTPSISGANASYDLATDGTATTVTITATDPEGFPIAYSIASDTSGNVATVTQGTGASANVFTITPSTNSANAGTFSLTFRASDGVNIATAVSSFTLVFTVQNSNYTTALITSVGANNAVNNSFDDGSTNNHTITANGNVTQNTFSPYRHGGYSTYFDGSGDSLSIADNAAFNFGSGDSTIEMWVYPLSSGTFNLITRGTSGYSGFILSSTGFLESTNGSSWAVNITFSTAITANSWQHVAVVRNGSTITVYRNGTSIGTSSISGSVSSAAQSLTIGQRAGQSDFSGYMTDLRIVKGTAVYTSAFTPPTERLTAITNTSLLTCHLPYIADGSSNAHSITVNGNTKTEPFSPYDHQIYSASNNGGSMYFDGTGDYLLMSSSAAFAPGAGDFTLEAWIYPTAAWGTWNGIFSVNNNAAIFFGGLDSGFGLRATAVTNIVSSTDPVLNTWTHVAVTRSGTTVRLFYNGVLKDTQTSSQNFPAGNLYIGSSVSSETFTGYIADARIINGTAVYTSAFTPPTAPLTAITNTSLLLNGTDAGIIDKSQSVKTITLSGDVKSSTTQSKYLTSSMYFDGTGDAVELSRDTDLDIFNLGASDFTIELWLYATDASTTSNIISFIRDNSSSDDNHPHIYFSNNQVIFYTDGTVRITSASSSLSSTTWTHIAVSRNGNDHKLFVNGTQSGSTYTAANTYTQGRPVLGLYYQSINTLSGNAFNGYMSDVRITKGLARYTANFTPPSTALQG